MPKDGLKSNQSERELKRRSTLDPSNFFRRDTPDREEASPSKSDNRSLAQRAASEDFPRPLVGTSSDLTHDGPPPSPPIQQSTPKTARFSLLRFRHASDSQLSVRAREHAAYEDIPPVPAMPTSMNSRRRQPNQANRADNTTTAPSIIMTPPTMDELTGKPTLQRTKSRKFHPFTRQKQSDGPIVIDPPSGRPSMDGRKSMDKRTKAENRKSRFGTFGRSRDPAEELRRLAGSRMGLGGDEALSLDHLRAASSLALPLGKKSESPRSEESGRPRTSFGAAPATSDRPERPRPTQTNSAFPFFSRRSKQRASLFPLPVRIPPPDSSSNAGLGTPRSSGSGRNSESPEGLPARSSPPRDTQPMPVLFGPQTTSQYPSSSALAASSISFAAPGGPLMRTNSVHSAHSSGSSPALAPPIALKSRARSSTLGSTSGRSEDGPPPTPPFATGQARDSTSTAGRSSFSTMFNLNRLRHGSDPHSPRGSPSHGLSTPAFGSHSNSLHLSREIYSLPDREEGETAMQFLTRAEETIPKSKIPVLLTDNAGEFHQAVMRSYMRKFAFFGDPLDMALRKLLMEVDLPKEAQQIDRVLQSFADRYHECNPGIFVASDKAYMITFSLLLLHSDIFNNNNKRKMNKSEYVKNTLSAGTQVSPDVLECFFDNVGYTPFIRVEDDMDIKTISSRKGKKVPKLLKNAVPDPAKKTSREPLDPYTYILQGNFDDLRPPLKGVLAMEDPYSYLGTAPSLDKSMLRSSKCGIIQLESARSRPDAFMSPSGIENPNEAKAGVVELPVDKVGVLWRKDPKKKTARSPWQEWGAILTGAGLYFFRNTGFVKNFIHQYEHHKKHGHGSALCMFTPAISTWKADYMLPTDNSVALLDTTYRKHKNAFIFFRHNNADETFLADNEAEMNDWMAKLNHQAAFKTAGVRPRGLIGGHYDGQRQRGMRRLESSNSTATLQTVQTPTGEVTIQSGKIDSELANQISTARRDAMQDKILESEDKLADAIKLLDDHLRDARHLLLLAPIHDRTRNNLLHAAGKSSVQLNWTRIEIWRMKCHRDILAMDLEEEKNEAKRRQDRIDRLTGKAKATSIASQSTASTTKPKPNGIERFSSNATSSTVKTLRAPQSPVSTRRPGTQSSAPSETSVTDLGEEEIFRTPPETTPLVTPLQSPLSLRTSGHRGSIISTTARSPRLRPQSLATEDPLDSPSLSEYRTPLMTDEDAERQREAGPLGGLDGASLDRPSTATSTEPDREQENEPDHVPSIAGSPDSRSKVRRSFRGTLREAGHRDSTSSHHRHSRKSNSKGDSISSAILPEDTVTSPIDMEPTEGLKREKGSFTVHGKKASVVTFGSEWANMSTEDRLKSLSRTESTTSHISPISPITSSSANEDTRPDHSFSIPPRKSSLSLRERRAAGNRKSSSASFAGRPTPPLLELGNPLNKQGADTVDRKVAVVERETGKEVAEKSVVAPYSIHENANDENEAEKDDDLSASLSSLRELETRTAPRRIEA